MPDDHTATDNGPLTTDSLRTCRRCHQPFSLPPTRLLLPTCPHCGQSLHPLLLKLKNNRNAAVLCIFALAALTAGILTPFISMSQLGDTRSFSLLGGIRELFERNNFLLASILLVFSVIFPYAKLLAILIATSRLSHLSIKSRHRLHQIAQFTGRYSLLDILVVAIIIVVVRFQGLAEARALPGTAFFALAVFLSIAAGFSVNLETPSNEIPSPSGRGLG